MKLVRFLSIFLTSSFLLTFLSGCSTNNSNVEPKKEETVSNNTIVWEVPVSGAKSAWEAPLNQILEEKNTGYRVEIREYIDHTTDDELNGTQILSNLRENKKAADIISISPTSSVSVDNKSVKTIYPFQEMVQEGLLEPLDDYLKLEQAKSLSDVILPDEWEWGKIDGITYKLSQYVYDYHGTIYNKDLLDKYKISTDSLSVNPFENEEIFKKIRDSENVIPYLTNASNALNRTWWSEVGNCSLLVCQTDGTMANALYTEEFREYLSNVQKFRQEKLIQFNDEFEDSPAQSFFARDAIVPAEHAEQAYATTYEYTKNGVDTSMDVIVIPDISSPCCGFEGGDAGTGIASWSKKKDKAFDFLVRLYTDTEIANLINQENDSLVGFPAYCSNKALLQTTNGTSLLSLMRQTYTEIEKKLPAGFRFDNTDVQDQIDAVQDSLGNLYFSSAPSEVQALFYGDCSNVDAALSTVQKTIDNAGMSKILTEAQSQLIAFQQKEVTHRD